MSNFYYFIFVAVFLSNFNFHVTYSNFVLNILPAWFFIIRWFSYFHFWDINVNMFVCRRRQSKALWKRSACYEGIQYYIVYVSYDFVTCNYNCNVFFFFYTFKQCTRVFHKILVVDLLWRIVPEHYVTNSTKQVSIIHIQP